MKDRAMQALHLLALEPVAETTADKNSYGFRPGRGTADAIGQSFLVLSRKDSATWVLEGDIRGCFDNIKHGGKLLIQPSKKNTHTFLEKVRQRIRQSLISLGHG